MKRVITLVLAPVFLLAIGCGKAPADKVAAAEKAVMEAKLAGAHAYMPEDFAKLDGMLNNAKKNIEEQDAKFVLFRDYDKVSESLAAVEAEAPKLIEETNKKKEEAREDAMKAHEAAKDAVKKTQTLVARAPVGKDRAAVEAIKNDARAMNAMLNEVQMAMDTGDYLAAQSKAKAVKEKSQSLAAEIKGAQAKVGGTKTSPAAKAAPAAQTTKKTTKKKK